MVILKLKLGKWLCSIRQMLLGPYVTALITEGKNGILVVPSDDFAVSRKLAFLGTYDPKQLGILTSKINAQSDVLVVGGHIGALAIPLSKHARNVDVVEANPRNFRFLQWNKELNQASNITLHPFAAGESEGEVEMLVSRHNSGGSKIAPKVEKEEFIYDAPERIRVPLKRLDAVFPNRKFEVIVMDIEGSEYAALGGMPQLLQQCGLLQLEIVPNHLDNVAGVSKEAFLSRLAPHFSWAEIIQTGVRYEKEAWMTMLENIYAHQYHAGVDVLWGNG